MKKFSLPAALLFLGLMASSACSETSLFAQSTDNEVKYGVTYTADSATEFLWGLTRPIHLWNTQQDGHITILPFWTHPFQAGGWLCWLNPRAWQLNPSLTAGTLISEVTMAVAASSGSSGSSSAAPVSNTSDTADTGCG